MCQSRRGVSDSVMVCRIWHGRRALRWIQAALGHTQSSTTARDGFRTHQATRERDGLQLKTQVSFFVLHTLCFSSLVATRLLVPTRDGHYPATVAASPCMIEISSLIDRYSERVDGCFFLPVVQALFASSQGSRGRTADTLREVLKLPNVSMFSQVSKNYLGSRPCASQLLIIEIAMTQSCSRRSNSRGTAWNTCTEARFSRKAFSWEATAWSAHTEAKAQMLTKPFMAASSLGLASTWSRTSEDPAVSLSDTFLSTPVGSRVAWRFLWLSILSRNVDFRYTPEPHIAFCTIFVHTF